MTIEQEESSTRTAGVADDAGPKADDGALQSFDLDSLPRLEIDQQRRAHRTGNQLDVRHDAIDDVGGDRYAFRAGQRFDLAAAGEELRARERVAPDGTDGQPRGAREPGDDTRHRRGGRRCRWR